MITLLDNGKDGKFMSRIMSPEWVGLLAVLWPLCRSTCVSPHPS